MRTPTIWLVAGEESGDQLGAKLMRALKDRLGDVAFKGVGGHAMEREGLASLFPLSDIAVNGISAVIRRLPSILRRIGQTAQAVAADRPDALVVIDSPDFTHRVARRVRRRLPDLPILNYVSPSVWAWRPGRAPRMRAYVDHVLALKPFEPAAHARLGGPPCTYVGHPLIERLSELRPAAGERRPLGEGPVELLVLPGSRRTEVSRLMEPFGAALARVKEAFPHPLSITLPAVAHLAPEIEAAAKRWPVAPRIVIGEAEKHAAFRRAHAALAASGTVTLELALSGVPMVVAYRVSKIEEQLRHVITVPSIVLANLILGENVVPERIQWDCTPEKLAQTLLPLLADTAERRRQAEAFARLDALMSTGAESPSEIAARIVCEVMAARLSPAAATSRLGAAAPSG
ncbi:MAG TPA: lipid-A-disaccharide synthase [Beijerinckiaceae bacterium]|nr:lipid-A-disaccharide synthase [Beijerinckiaceae bacterium]